MQYKTWAKELLSDVKITYLQMMNKAVHKILQGFQGIHVAEKKDEHTKDHTLKITASLNFLATLLHRLG